jgi:2,3-bisphosphoglycerate-dependent phosphoglycerate mutase
VTKLLLVRHGETAWNAQRRWQGRDDPPLNKAGVRQAEALADELTGEPIDVIYSSDLRRALQTAEIVAARLALDVRPLPALREIDVGSWSGLTWDELEQRFPEQLARHLESWGSGWEDGETPAGLTERVDAAVRQIADAHADGRVLVVTHGGVIRALSAIAHGVPFGDFTRGAVSFPNCCVARFACENGGFRSLD